MEYEFADYEVREGVAVITMNRYERRNSTSYKLRRDTAKALLRFEQDESLPVAVITGVKNTFCTGEDLKERRQQPVDESREEKLARMERESAEAPHPVLVLQENRVTKPVIAAVNGYAVGGGFGFAMMCDLKVAAESATFWMPETAIGWGGPISLWVEAILPHALAMEISLSQYITAQRAYEAGLLNRVVPDNRLMTSALEMAHSVAKLPRLSTREAVFRVRKHRRVVFEDILGRVGAHENRSKLAAEISERLTAFASGIKPAGPGAS